MCPERPRGAHHSVDSDAVRGGDEAHVRVIILGSCYGISQRGSAGASGSTGVVGSGPFIGSNDELAEMDWIARAPLGPSPVSAALLTSIAGHRLSRPLSSHRGVLRHGSSRRHGMLK